MEFVATTDKDSTLCNPGKSGEQNSKLSLEPVQSEAPRKRKVLSLKEKLSLVKAIEKSPGKKITKIAREFGVNRRTLADIIKKKDALQEMVRSGIANTSTKRMRKSNHEEVEEALLDWFQASWESRIPVNKSHLISKTNDIAVALGEKDWSTVCKSSWTNRFCNRYSITINKETGLLERNVKNNSIVHDWFKDSLQPAVDKHGPENVFFVREFSLCWRTLPDQISLADKSNPKERLTILLCSNFTGTEKWPVLCIGNYKNPKSFEGIKKLPVLYEFESQSWITSEIFSHWMISFNDAMLKQKRKVVVIIKSKPEHRIKETLSRVDYLTLPKQFPEKSIPGTQLQMRFKTNYR